MAMKIESTIEYNECLLVKTTARFAAVARCTNVYTFDLARPASARYGIPASELGSVAHAKTPTI